MNVSSLQPLNTKYMRVAYAAILTSILVFASISLVVPSIASDDDSDESNGVIVSGSASTRGTIFCFTGADPEPDCIKDRKVDLDDDGVFDLRVTTRQLVSEFLEGSVLVGKFVGVQTIWEDLHTNVAHAEFTGTFAGTVGDSEPGTMTLVSTLVSDRSRAPEFFSFDFSTIVLEGSGIGGLEGICGGGTGHGEGPPFASSSQYEFRFGDACSGNNDDSS